VNRAVASVAVSSLRAFFIECSGRHWVSIARRLAEGHAVEPVLWTGDRATVAEATGAFPDIVANVGVDSTCGRFPQAASWPVVPLDDGLLRALAVEESITLAMMDRMDLGPGKLDHDARRRHWHDLLRCWSAALDALQPDVVIFSMTPHHVYDFVLYALCRLRGVPTRMFERAPTPGLVFMTSRFEEGSAEVRERLLRDDTADELSDAAKRHIEQLRAGGEGALPPNYRKKLAKRGILGATGRQSGVGLSRIVAFELRRAAYLLLRRKQPPEHYYAHEDGTGRLVSPGVAGWIAGRWRAQWRKWRLRRLLEGLSRPLPADRPYVLLALHFQPERAIVPMAGAYGDQNLIVDLLARCLPPGWLLAVKEHPWQLVPFSRGELSRSAGFYRRMADHPNVVLVPPEADSQALIAGARAVATATGSAGWQALARGVPVLVFGAAWYSAAPGVHRIGDRASCEAAIAAIARGDTVPAGAAERMLAAVEAVAVRGYLEPDLEAVEGVSATEAAENMSSALAGSIRAGTDSRPPGSSPRETGRLERA